MCLQIIKILDDLWVNGGTVALWYNWKDDNSDTNSLLQKGAGTVPGEGWELQQNDGNAISFKLDSDGGTDGDFVTDTIVVTDTWYRLV